MKVGDRVKIIGKNHAYAGENGVIVGNEYWDFDYQVKVDESKADWIPFYANELELIK